MINRLRDRLNKVLPVTLGLLVGLSCSQVKAQSAWGDTDYYGLPWVANISHPYKISRGLDGRHLSIWASHGRYFNKAQDSWSWQRVNCFGTTEDLFTQTFVVPYIIPMLERAGAVVFSPRERDWQKNEKIVDNDSPYSGYSDDGHWSVFEQGGFSIPNGKIQDGYLPFSKGTSKYAETTKRKASSTATYTPYLDEAGKYAVYVSYQTLSNSVADAHYTVVHKGVRTSFSVNQTMGSGTWVYLGTFEFGTGDDNCVIVDNKSAMKGVVSTDAVRFGGGMGNVERGGRLSGLPRCLEGARYYAEWAGAPYDVYGVREGVDDYADDINARSAMTNWLAGGSVFVPDRMGENVPIELSLAVHSDAGYRPDKKSIFGTLGICTTDFEDGRLANGTSRMLSYDFAKMMLDQLDNDITKTYGKWKIRDLWDKNYAETRMPAVPSAILEIFSHESLPDMLLGYDPNFKFTLSRAVYKSVLRFVTAQHKEKAVVQPLAPDHFQMKLNSGGDLILKWKPVSDPLEPTAKADKYILYTAKENGDYDNGTIFAGTTANVQIESDKIYRFRVSAINKGGESQPSEELACLWHPGSKQIMVLNGFHRLAGPAVKYNEGGKPVGFDMEEDPGVSYGRTACWLNHLPFVAGNDFNYTTEHVKAIASTRKYSVVSCSAEVISELNLSRFQLIDLILGNERNDGYSLKKYQTFTPAIKEKLRYFSSPLIVSGSYVGSDNQSAADSTFVADALGIDYIQQYKDRADSAQIITGMGVDYDVYRSLNEYHYASISSDVIMPQNGLFTAMLYADGSSAAVASKEKKRFIMGFPLECIKSEEQRGLCMRSIVQFLLK